MQDILGGGAEPGGGAGPGGGAEPGGGTGAEPGVGAAAAWPRSECLPVPVAGGGCATAV